MNTQTPNTTGSRVLSSADRGYSTLSTTTVDVENSRAPATSTWHGPLISSGASQHDEKPCAGHGTRLAPEEEVVMRDARTSLPTRSRHLNIPEQLAELIISMIPGPEGKEMAEAYREATDLPPITNLSLSELDIQNIIPNIRLRHDVNFDRDLSFRPNLDGSKGQEKMKAAQKYWRALVAELELYTRLFRGTPPLRELKGTDWTTVTRHAERRIPIIFQTIQDVLKSLVPDRDHSRVDEHLDVPMLMQEIERGVCDLVRLAEWMAHLLKEHCAPMRDGWVDKMVAYIKLGVTTNSSGDIVKGLCELLGILEAMKLDVANHQIRNLKTLLIEDTINFEKHYHLDRLVNGRARVNINTAHTWYSLAVEDFGQQCITPRHEPLRLQLEVFVRAVTATIFNRDGGFEFPETFYLDQDRLRVLKAEIEDVVSFDICFDMFANLIKQFGYEGPVSPTTRQQLRISLSAIMGEAIGYGFQTWIMNSEALSLEILRQASLFAGQPQTHDLDSILKAEQLFRHLFHTSAATHAERLEASMLLQVLACANRHSNSSPTDLFNTLVPVANSVPLPPAQPSRPATGPDSFTFLLPQHAANTKLMDIANRITHIVLLHWRIWRPIAYVQEEEMKQSSGTLALGEVSSLSASPQPPLTNRSSAHPAVDGAQGIPNLNTRDVQDSGQESSVAHETPSQ
ncbi:hypothetical protein P153DRAFT_296059 [Dothidotthia symphoricarpi CBS 119687]|uniref:Tcp11-domain-containing protein n=1 Tax=Dothidotthia symphoricarpi CBS 119687 TaxID=1392245 RepID=A0A6A6A5Z8_9PLEO|nr:uncharacterized protein P153DRAFT_296059 [Dothidotthia symphoricarpi CBS 119687]KAF2127250.1 hypothetical protein P153DRAFT_296059 [Dothidotthia symphoricarpi CBS 119687]